MHKCLWGKWYTIQIYFLIRYLLCDYNLLILWKKPLKCSPISLITQLCLTWTLKTYFDFSQYLTLKHLIKVRMHTAPWGSTLMKSQVCTLLFLYCTFEILECTKCVVEHAKIKIMVLLAFKEMRTLIAYHLIPLQLFWNSFPQCPNKKNHIINIK